MIDVLYFAWVRERVGLPRERVETQATTVGGLVDELRAREERYQAAFADLSSLRVALDQDLASFDAPLAGVREVASHITPVPGGVGPMTITMLLVNTLEAAEAAAH